MAAYIKEFDRWNIKKQSLEDSVGNTFYFSEREIWWASLGVNIGKEKEIDGKNDDYARPVLIIRKFSADSLWIISITKTPKDGNYFHTIHVNDEPRTLSLLQLRMISEKRLLRKIYKIREEELNKICDKIICLLLKNETPHLMRGISGA